MALFQSVDSNPGGTALFKSSLTFFTNELIVVFCRFMTSILLSVISS